MTTTMLDALADEANEITMLGKQATIALQGILTRAAALSQQLDILNANGERLVGGEVEIISSVSTVDEFAAFQARHFPYRALQPSGSVGSYPAAQDDGQGNQGSAEAKAAPPSDGFARTTGEAEQVVAEEASGERFVGRDDPGADPDLPTIKDRFLDLWAETLDGVTAISRILACPAASGSNYLIQARRDGDTRAVRGDAARKAETEKAEARLQPEAKPYTPPAADAEPPKEHKAGEVLALNVHSREAYLDGKTISLPKHDYRMVQALNEGQPVGIEPMLVAAQVMTAKRLNTMVESLSDRLEVIGVEIEISPGPLYTLKHL